MLTLLVAWAAMPAVLAAGCWGVGLALEAAGGRDLPRALLVPLGMAGVVVLLTATTQWPVLVWASGPAVVVAALAGVRLRRRRGGGWWRAARWPLAAAAAAGVVHGLPVLATGTPTFAGWIKLDDGATWLAFADHLVAAGRTTDGLAPSTSEALLAVNLGEGYPTGAFPPLGLLARLLHTDSAWLLQPYLACGAGMVALVAWTLLAPYVAPRPVRALAAVLAACSALLVGYAWWGGVKELLLAPLLALLAALLPGLLGPPGPAGAVGPAGGGAAPGGPRPAAPSLRRLLPSAVVGAAVVALNGPSGAVWLAVPGLVLAAGWVRLHGWGPAGRAAGALLGGVAVLSAPTLAGVGGTWLGAVTALATSDDDIGPLWGHLSDWQVMGIWPATDFRGGSVDPALTAVLIAVVGALAVAGLVRSVRVRDVALPVYAGGVVLVAVAANAGGAWIGGKALAVASPAALVAAGAGAGWLLAAGRRVEGSVALAVVAGGVAWSLALAYATAWLAPQDELAELADIGRRYAGASPALMVDYSPYGARHFLRRLDAEGAGELRRRLVPMLDGRGLDKAAPADIDQFRQTGLDAYDVLVLRRSGRASRPPSTFALVETLATYEVWRRVPGAPVALARLPLGDASDPAADAPCASVASLAALVGTGGALAYVERPPSATADLASAALPAGWTRGARAGSVVPSSAGRIDLDVDLPVTGTYRLWLQGWFRGSLEVQVDGLAVYTGRHRLTWTGTDTQVGTIPLPAGRHTVALVYGGADLHPGSTGATYPLGPLTLSTTTADSPVRAVPVSKALALCGRHLDWVEVLAPPR